MIKVNIKNGSTNQKDYEKYCSKHRMLNEKRNVGDNHSFEYYLLSDLFT